MFIQKRGTSRTRCPIKNTGGGGGNEFRNFRSDLTPIDIKTPRTLFFYDQERNAFYNGINAIRACHVLRYGPNKRAPRCPTLPFSKCVTYLRYKHVWRLANGLRAIRATREQSGCVEKTKTLHPPPSTFKRVFRADGKRRVNCFTTRMY